MGGRHRGEFSPIAATIRYWPGPVGSHTYSRQRARASCGRRANRDTTLECHVTGTTMYRIRNTCGDNHRFRISKALNLRAVSIPESGMRSAVTDKAIAVAARGPPGHGRRKSKPSGSAPSVSLRAIAGFWRLDRCASHGMKICVDRNGSVYAKPELGRVDEASLA